MSLPRDIKVIKQIKTTKNSNKESAQSIAQRCFKDNISKENKRKGKRRKGIVKNKETCHDRTHCGFIYEFLVK